MSRLGDIAIGVIIGVGGLIGAALAWDKYENSSNAAKIETEETITSDELQEEFEKQEKPIIRS